MTSQQRFLRFGLSPSPSPYTDTGVLGEHSARMSPAVRAAVLRRDVETCQLCGFRSLKYQTVLGSPGGRDDIDGVFTSCTFCEQVMHADLVPAQRSGVLLWLPEISQAQLNRSMHDLYALRITQGDRAQRARALLDRLMARRNTAEERFGSDNPETLVDRLREKAKNGQTTGLCPYEAADQGLRLFPLDRRILREEGLEFNQFPQMLAFWRSKDGPLRKDLLDRSRTFEELELRLSSL
ncbi:MAG: type IV secretion protein DotN [Thermoanaerobaculia bacterium]|nr:type IV secretion protein DotN [Thermoanaerobaculia bacterium]